MENLDYKNLLLEIIFALKDKSEYLKFIDSTDTNFNRDYFDGMAMAYHQVLDYVKTSLLDEENINISDFGLEDFDPNEILEYKPK